MPIALVYNEACLCDQVEHELEEERRRGEEAEKQAKEAIEAKMRELHQIEADRQREVLL